MPPPLQIVWTTKGINDLLKQTKQASAAFKSLAGASNLVVKLGVVGGQVNSAAKSLQVAAMSMRSAAADINKAASALGKVGVGKGGGAFDPNKTQSWKMPKSSFTGGPNQRLADLQNQLNMANRMGNLNAVKDLQYQIARVQKQLANQNKGPAAKFMDALMTSRVTWGPNGPQLMPLVNRLVALAGPEATAIAAVVAGFGLVADKAAEAGKAFYNLAISLGSGRSTTATVQGLAGALGMSPDSMAAIAGNIQSKITGDPMGRAVGAQMGIQNIQGYFGSQDYGKQLLKVVDGLRTITNYEERLRAARALGAEALLPLTRLSENQYGKVKQDAAVTSNIFDPQMIQQSADFMAALGRIGPALSNLFTVLGKPLLGQATNLMNDFADGINALATILGSPMAQQAIAFMEDWVTLIPRLFDSLFDLGKALGALMSGNLSDAAKSMQDVWNDFADPSKIKGINEGMDRLSDATDRNTEATFKLSGQYGKSARLDTGRGIPPGLTGPALQRALQQGGINLPFF